MRRRADEVEGVVDEHKEPDCPRLQALNDIEHSLSVDRSQRDDRAVVAVRYGACCIQLRHVCDRAP